MGLFDFLLKKEELQDEDLSYDIDNYLQEELKTKLEEQGHFVEIEDGSIFVDSKVEILTTVFTGSELSPDTVYLHAVIKVDDYFLSGIKEKIVGTGVDDKDKVSSLVNEFVSTSLVSVFKAFTDNNSDLDFSRVGELNTWHPILSPYAIRGEWGDNLPGESEMFSLLKDWLKDQILDRKFNWLRVNVVKQADGKITGDCYLNNESKETGYNLLKNYARTWDNNKQFRSIKQFILIRRSDVS